MVVADELQMQTGSVDWREEAWGLITIIDRFTQQKEGCSGSGKGAAKNSNQQQEVKQQQQGESKKQTKNHQTQVDWKWVSCKQQSTQMRKFSLHADAVWRGAFSSMVWHFLLFEHIFICWVYLSAIFCFAKMVGFFKIHTLLLTITFGTSNHKK